MADDWFTRYPGLEFTRHPEGVLLITIDRPAAMNATDAALHRALSRIWADVDDDPDTRVVVITGKGKAFSAGGDLAWIETMVGNYAGMQAAFREAGDIVYGMTRCTKIIISAINGVAVGAGLAVALMADISLMAEEAKITDGHIRLGVAAGDHANIAAEKSISLAAIHDSSRMVTATMERILGTNTSVCSWIWVTACTMLTTRPTTRPAIMIGADIQTVVQRASRPRSRTSST